MNKLIDTLQFREHPYAIEYNEIVEGKLDEWIGMGLLLMTFCEYGVRSANTAQYMGASGVPSVYLYGGLSKFVYENGSNPKNVAVAKSIQKVPRTVVTLHDDELARYRNVILELTGKELAPGDFYTSKFEQGVSLWYPMIANAIHSLSQMNWTNLGSNSA